MPKRPMNHGARNSRRRGFPARRIGEPLRPPGWSRGRAGLVRPGQRASLRVSSASPQTCCRASLA